MKELNFAIQVAQKAGKLLLKKFNHLSKKDVSFKDRHEVVTKLDYASEEIIIKAIRQKFPNHGILSEESGYWKGKNDYLWIIDPLDGTTNYKIGSPIFAVLIALAYKGKLQLGVAYAPAMNELYEAEKGKGAQLNGRKIKVSKISEIKDAINLYCHGTTTDDIRQAVRIYDQLKLHGRDSRQLGSAAVEFGFVAAGRAESITIPGAHPWDVAVGTLLIREAGGKVTDFQGKDWNLQSKDILGSNNKIHNQLLEIIRGV